MKLLNTSGIKVDRDSALELMVYHLQMAHIMFQNTEEGAISRDEMLRIMQRQYLQQQWVDDGGLGQAQLLSYWEEAPEIAAGVAWFDQMTAIYEEMKKDD